MNQLVFRTLVLMALVTEAVQQTERNSSTAGLSSHESQTEPQPHNERRNLRKKKYAKADRSTKKKKHLKAPKKGKKSHSTKSPKKGKKSHSTKSPKKGKKKAGTKSPKSAKKKKGHKKGKVPKKCTVVESIFDGDDDDEVDTDIRDMYSNGRCDAELNSEDCYYDGGDCSEFNENFPDCSVPQPSWVGDTRCDGPLYNTTECGYDGGDCLDVIDFGCSGGANGYCENIFNNERCDFDNGDCTEFNNKYPNCKVPDPSYVGDGVCDIGAYYTLECGWDGGDCANFPQNCTVEDTYAIGDGVCQVEFNTTDCEYDGGDCIMSR